MFENLAKRNRPDTGAFTLIELLVVISVIAILMSLLMPTLNMVRKRANVVAVNSLIDGLSLAVATYNQIYDAYPPDKHPQLDKSSECLVYYLSGGSIYYEQGVSPDGYPWTHNMYNVNSGGKGRKTMPIPYQFKGSFLVDNDADHAPELVDKWQKELIYNAGPTQNTSYNQYGGAKHCLKRCDLFSPGPDQKYGTDDDITNWGSNPCPGEDYDYCTWNE